MKRLRLAGSLLGCLYLLSAALAVQAEAASFELQCVSDDKFLRIHADHAVDPARCAAIAERVLKAHAFSGKQSSWRNPKLLWAKPLQFRLLGGSLKVLGYAEGPDLMVMRDDYLDNPLSEGTLAHELTHIQDLRQLRGSKLPSFLLEGRALTIGHDYRMSLGQPENEYDRRMAGSALRFTSKNAEELLKEYRGKGWDNQAIGTVLVEYMRTKWNGAGLPDVQSRLARAIETMAEGAGFEAAFQKEFGAAFAALRKSFMKHLDDTKDDPRARLQGTIWRSTSPSASSGTAEN